MQMVETEPDRQVREVDALEASLLDAFDAKHPGAGADGAVEAVRLCFLDDGVLGPDTLVVRVAMADDPDNTVYFHAAEEETAKVYGEVVDSGVLIECERRIGLPTPD
jgi:hypothetical protein